MKRSEIETIASEQKERLLASDSGMIREALASLTDTSTHALIISGIRRCGKSTLLHQYLLKQSGEFFYFHFEDIRLYNFQTNDFKLLDTVINNSGAKILFFDEIQSVKGWELFVRQKLDAHFKVVITGSNASLLSREFGTKLTGRHITKELFPFSYREFINFKRLKPSFDSLVAYMQNGGFPEFLQHGNIDTLKMLIDDIVYRDIVVRHSVKDASSVKRLLSYLLYNAANLTSPSKLTSVAGVKSSTTVLEYFSYFEDAYLIAQMHKFSYSAKAQALAPKKIYVCDAGLIRAGAVLLSENYGYFLENMVFIHLRRKQETMYYYNDHDKECDFVIVRHNKPIAAIQVCWELTSDNEEREINGLTDAMRSFNLNKGMIVTANQRDTLMLDDLEISIVPAFEFFIK